MPRFPTGALNAALLSTFLSRSAASCTATYTAVGINYVQVHSLFLCTLQSKLFQSGSCSAAGLAALSVSVPLSLTTPRPPCGKLTPLVCSPMPSRQLGHHFPLKLPPQPPPTAQAPKKTSSHNLPQSLSTDSSWEQPSIEVLSLRLQLKLCKKFLLKHPFSGLSLTLWGVVSRSPHPFMKQLRVPFSTELDDPLPSALSLVTLSCFLAISAHTDKAGIDVANC